MTIPGMFRDPASWTDQKYVDRRDDTRAALDGILADIDVGPHLDRARIGGAGHSLGGYTVGQIHHDKLFASDARFAAYRYDASPAIATRR